MTFLISDPLGNPSTSFSFLCPLFLSLPFSFSKYKNGIKVSSIMPDPVGCQWLSSDGF